MKEIHLTQGKVALVSDEDYEYLMQWKWWAQKRSNNWYAGRSINLGKNDEGRIKTKTIHMHRVIAERMGLDSELFVDHIDRNGLNNTRVNLRSATKKQNNENKSIPISNTSGAKGVCHHKKSKKWCAYITHDYKSIWLGTFDNFKDAVKARKEAEKKYWTHHD